jgi:hypothetical protein
MNELRATCAHHKSAAPEPSKVDQFIVAVKDFVAAIS